MRAVAAGDRDAVAAELAAGADVDAIAEGAESALSIAVDAGDDAIVAQLLDAGADVMVRAAGDRTLLHLAARHDKPGLVRRLVDAGARLDARGESPVDVAIAHGHAGVAELLLELPGSDRIWKATFGTACGWGNLTVLRLLWARYETAVLGLEPNPLMRAADGGQVEAIHFLIDLGFRVDDFDLKEERSPLMHAVAAGHRAAVVALLDRGARVDAMTEWFVTALGIAQQRGDEAMIQLLRERGAQGEAVERSAEPEWRIAERAQETAIENDDAAALARMIAEGGKHAPDDTWIPPVRLPDAIELAARLGATACLGLLLARGGDPMPALVAAIRASQSPAVRMILAAPRTLDATHAALACRQPDPWILRDLLEHGAPADAKGYGRPLELAAYDGRWHHAALLLDRGAHLDEDANRSSPLLFAAGAGYVRFVETLLDRDRSDARQRRIDAALLAGVAWPRVVAAMLRRGANPLARDRDGNTLLHLGASAPEAAIDLHLSLVGQLLETPARLGWMPLHCATMSGSLETIEKLLAAGARVDARSEDGTTPLHLACTYPRPHVVETLLAAGAAVDAVDAKGETALHHAMSAGAEPVEQLLRAGANPRVRDAAGRTPLDRGTALLSSIWSDRSRIERAIDALRAHLAALQ